MDLIKVSLPIAYMIESLRHNGVSDQELLKQVEKKDISSWESFNLNFDFNELIKLSEKNPHDFNSIIHDGYSVKFLTINGLKNLLWLKFHKKESQDYHLNNYGISTLTLNKQQYLTLQQLLSSNWNIQEIQTEVNGKITINIKLINH